MDVAPIAVTVVAGLDRDATSLLASGLLTRTQRSASIWVDPTTADEWTEVDHPPSNWHGGETGDPH